MSSRSSADAGAPDEYQFRWANLASPRDRDVTSFEPTEWNCAVRAATWSLEEYTGRGKVDISEHDDWSTGIVFGRSVRRLSFVSRVR